jgi:Cd(II)/Pb(II)-responsive transcriptional regulator
MKIGELATLTHTPVETIRYYEREGLLPQAARTGGNYRIYNEAQATRLSFIRHCRGLDMTLDEIRTLLRFKDAPTRNCGDVNALLDAHIGHVAARIRELRLLEKQLKSLREQCHEAQDAAHCGILNELTDIASRPGRPNAGHVHGTHARSVAHCRAPAPRCKTAASGPQPCASPPGPWRYSPREPSVIGCRARAQAPRCSRPPGIGAPAGGWPCIRAARGRYGRGGGGKLGRVEHDGIKCCPP